MQHAIDTLKSYARMARDYIEAHWRQLAIGGGIALGLVLIIALFVYNNRSKVVYQPVNACDLFTVAESHDLLGKDTIGNVTTPTVSGNTATSICTFSDSNPSQDQMKVAAVKVRSGINDEGVEQNKAQFAAKQSAATGEAVTGFGDQAFFDKKLGQLNVLDGRNWYVFSYGVGAAPSENTLSDAVDFAYKVLPQRSLKLNVPTF